MATSEEQTKEKEGTNLLGSPTFKKLENGRFKCVETEHELLAKDKDSYSQCKRCRLGLIDYAVAHSKPPVNMFKQDPLFRSKLMCKLTGETINKSEEHIWKHISGKRFLNKLEEKETQKLSSNGKMEDMDKQIPQKASKPKKDKVKKKKKEKPVEEAISSEVGKSSDGEDYAVENGSKDSEEHSKRTKRTSIEIGPSSFASRKKKKAFWKSRIKLSHAWFDV